jgi:hypothetical protein
MLRELYAAVVGAIQLQRAFHLASTNRSEDALKVLARPALKRLMRYRNAEASIEARLLRLYLVGAAGGIARVGTLLKDIRATASFNADEKCLLYGYALAAISLFLKPQSGLVAEALARIEFSRARIHARLLSRYDYQREAGAELFTRS